MWEWKVLIEQLLLVTLSRQKRLQFLFLRFQFRFRFRIPAFPYARGGGESGQQSATTSEPAFSAEKLFYFMQF